MVLSVLVPTRNRAGLLARTLRAISAVDFPKDSYEVIVIDTASTDSTPGVAHELGAKFFPNFRYEHCDRPGLHIGRHRGAKVAQSDILVYTDDDVRPFPSWLSAISETFEQDSVAMVGGQILPDYEAQPPKWLSYLWHEVPEGGRILGELSLADLGEGERTIRPTLIWGCNYSIRRSVLYEAGGFLPDVMPESLQVYVGGGEVGTAANVMNMGCRAIYHPSASVYHWVPRTRMTFRYLYRRSFSQGISESFTHTRAAGRPVLSQQGSPYPSPWKQLSGAAHSALHWRLRRFFVNFVACSGQRAGYHFHQRALERDPKLLEWVLRDNYWDEEASPRL